MAITTKLTLDFKVAERNVPKALRIIATHFKKHQRMFTANHYMEAKGVIRIDISGAGARIRVSTQYKNYESEIQIFCELISSLVAGRDHDVCIGYVNNEIMGRSKIYVRIKDKSEIIDGY